MFESHQTPPDRQAQVDFVHFRTAFSDESGTERILWLLFLVLGDSRVPLAHFVLHQDLPTLLRCQAAAPEALGGVPEHILYDRMRSVEVVALRPLAVYGEVGRCLASNGAAA